MLAGLFVAFAMLVVLAAVIFLRRWYVQRNARLHELHVRLLRSELMQAVARGDQDFLIEHWSKHDRKAALDVASQILNFLKGPDRLRLEAIVEENRVLRHPLLQINRLGTARRIAMIRRLAAFGNQSVQGTLHTIMREDRSSKVRLEAAIAIAVAGQLPPPWRIIRSVWRSGEPITPNHYLLFRSLVPTRTDALMALALMHEDASIRLLAIDALGFGVTAQVEKTLVEIAGESDPIISAAARKGLERLAQIGGTARRVRGKAAARAEQNIAARRAA